jgi:hypothetical protein
MTEKPWLVKISQQEKFNFKLEIYNNIVKTYIYLRAHTRVQVQNIKKHDHTWTETNQMKALG